MTFLELLVGLTIAVGLVGVVVPVLPGSALILAAVVVWAAADGSTAAWLFASTAVVFLAVGTIVKYLVPGRRLKEAGVPMSSLAAGAVLGVVGFFVVPVVGLVLGFVLGVYLAEARRLGTDRAWPSTVLAVKAVGVSLLVELAAALLAAATWALGVLLT